MQKKIKINPFNIQFTAILFVLGIYSFGWSKINKPLQLPTLFFLGFILVSLLMFSKLYNTYVPVDTMVDFHVKEPMTLWILVGLISMIAEFIYEKAIPIVEILILHNGYNYVNFKGIPVFHVFAVTYTSFLGLWLFDIFIQNKRFSSLLLSVFFASYPLMLFNRGGFLFNVVSICFIFLYRKKKVTLSINNIILVLLSFVLISYLFGVFGNYRSLGASNHKNEDYYTSSEYIMTIGRATNDFKDSRVPKEFFWMYLYISTPLANLENIIEKTSPMYKTDAFLTQAILPDFIGKRIEKHRHLFIPKDELVSRVFNVSTYFAGAYKTMGLPGMILVFYYFSFVVFGITFLLNRLYTIKVVGLGILFTISIFCLFSNMLTFSGLFLQLAYPILFGLYKRI